MRSEARDLDRAAERGAWVQALMACTVILAMAWFIEASSIQTEMARSGGQALPLYPWVIEGTSVLVTLALLPFVLELGIRMPLEPGRLSRAIPAHMAGLLAFSAIHVFAMMGLREMIWALAYQQTYTYFDAPLRDFVYELRKDAGTYVLFQLVLGLFRALEHARLETRAARREARREQRITLKCGGRTFHPEAGEFVQAKAAGNYVEARFGAREHLARATLSELEALLKEAGVDAVRCHRSWLVNRARIEEVRPTGEGDVTLTLDDGSEVPGSRRYRAGLGQA